MFFYFYKIFHLKKLFCLSASDATTATVIATLSDLASLLKGTLRDS